MIGFRASVVLLFVSLLIGGGLGCARESASRSGSGGPTIRIAVLQNKAGKFIGPETIYGQKALSGTKLPDDLVAWVSDPDGDEAYPIVTYTWIIAYRKYADAKKADALRDLFKYCLTDGQKESESLGYIPLPVEVAAQAKAALGNIQGEGKAKAAPGGTLQLQGAGASFPAPLYAKWFKTYQAMHAEVQIDYQPVGSSRGVKAVIDKAVDFGASDAAMSREEIAKVEGGVQLLPLTAGSIVVAYNLAGVDDLRLNRDAYAGIFLGKIKKWNDKAIADANPGVKLPDSEINVVVRSDGSGTTYVFTKHLSAISEAFAAAIGASKQPAWPVGARANGNDGVALAIKTTPGSIGYLEYGYVKSEKP